MLYYSSECPYSKKVLRYLHHIQKTLPMNDISQSGDAKQEFLKLSTQKITPCLLIDKQLLYDPEVIIQWLAEHQDKLLPKTEP